mgnify:CR=1 FL=1
MHVSSSHSFISPLNFVILIFSLETKLGIIYFFTVEAENNSKENIYIQKVFLNGKPYKKTYIIYDDILNGSTLKFVMGKKPNKAFGKAAVDRPIVLNK